MKTVDPRAQSLGALGDSLNNLLDAQRALGTEVLGLVGAGVGALLGTALEQAAGQKTSSCCDIPEPCWMPKSLGEFHCRLCPGTSGSIRLFVTNEDIRPRTMVALASGAGAGQIAFSPASLPLGPKERGTITVTFTLPGKAPEGESLEALVWLRGCRDYYLRWTVTAAARPQACCHEVAVADGPDHVLHWYHHFYCPRGCFGGGKAG